MESTSVLKSIAALAGRSLEDCPPRLVYDVVLALGRLVSDQYGPTADISLAKFLAQAYPYDAGVWIPVSSQPAPTRSVPGPYLYRRCYSPVARVVAWSRRGWRAADAPYGAVPPLPGDLWRPMTEKERIDYHAQL